MGALQLVLAGGIYVPSQAIRGDLPAGEEHLSDEPLSHSGLAGTENLTPRQREVLAHLRAGKSNKQIAHELGLTEGTVKVHVTAILRLLGVRNRTQAALTAHGV